MYVKYKPTLEWSLGTVSADISLKQLKQYNGMTNHQECAKSETTMG